MLMFVGLMLSSYCLNLSVSQLGCLPVQLETINPDDLFGNGNSADGGEIGQSIGPADVFGPASPATQPDGERRRKTKRNARKSSHAAADTYSSSYDQQHPDTQYLYPAPEELGVVSPASSSDSDPGVSGVSANNSNFGDTAAGKPRQRRSRVSYSTMTEKKYHRIRDLNNEASRLYRERHRSNTAKMAEQEKILTERNKVLRQKAAKLQDLRDQMETFCHNFLSQGHASIMKGQHTATTTTQHHLNQLQ